MHSDFTSLTSHGLKSASQWDFVSHSALKPFVRNIEVWKNKYNFKRSSSIKGSTINYMMGLQNVNSRNV